jgi:hypothetical protein
MMQNDGERKEVAVLAAENLTRGRSRRPRIRACELAPIIIGAKSFGAGLPLEVSAAR